MRYLSDAVDTELFKETQSESGELVSYSIPVTAYPTDSSLIIVNSPGSGELKDGREDRWKNLGKHLQTQGLATLVTYNAPRPDFKVQLEWEPYSYRGASWNRILIESLSYTLDWAIENAPELCGNASPPVYREVRPQPRWPIAIPTCNGCCYSPLTTA